MAVNVLPYRAEDLVLHSSSPVMLSKRLPIQSFRNGASVLPIAPL